MTTPADHDKRCPAAWDTSVKCNCGAQAADEIALIEKTLKSVGITSLLNHGAASCVFTEGCCGVSQDHILAYTRKIALYCAVAIAAPSTAQAEGWTKTEPLIARSRGEWHEDDGPVVWWSWNGHGWAGESPWCGTPLDSDWPGYHTHWTPAPPAPTLAEGVEHE